MSVSRTSGAPSTSTTGAVFSHSSAPSTTAQVFGAAPTAPTTAPTIAPPIASANSLAALDDMVATMGLAGAVAEAEQELAVQWQNVSGRMLKAMRMRAGLRQAALAAAIGTTQSAVARLESGRQDCLVTTVERIAGALGADPVDVFNAIRGDRRG